MKLATIVRNLSIIVFLMMGIIATTGSSFLQTSSALYVDAATGSDSNNGASLTTAYKTIQKAVTNAKPGTVIYVRAGTYNEAIVVNVTGTASAPITLTHYGSETVTINGGSNMALSTSGAVSYWVLDGLTFKALTSRYTLELGFWGTPETTYWTVRNNTIFGANYIMGSYHLWENNNISGAGYTGTNGDAGISDGNDSHNNTYRNNTIHDFTGTDARGIWTQGKTHDNLIFGNTVYNITTASGLGQCIDLDGAGNVEWRQTVLGNHVSNCSYVGIQLENAFATTVQNNIVTGGTAGIIVINYDAGVGCKTGGESNQYGDTNGDNNCQGDTTNDLFIQNLITTSTGWGGGYGGIMNWYAGGVKIWGNTFSAANSNNNGAINFQGTAAQTQGGSIKGNIITQGSGVSICAQDLASFKEDSNNLFYRTNNGNPYAQGTGCNTTYSLAQYQTNSGKGQNSVSGDPLFKNAGGSDFHLTAGSPAIDHGLNLGLTSDPDGCARPSGAGYDIGFYEYGGASPTATSVATQTSTAASTMTSTPVATTSPAAPSGTPAVTATLLAPTSTLSFTPKPTYTFTPSSTPAPTNWACGNCRTIVPSAAPTSASISSSGVDLALGKSAIQSSTYMGAAAARAVDGNSDGVLAHNSVSHTNSDPQAWWQVDLGSSSPINSINIWNRSDCCDWRLTNFYLFVSDVPFMSNNLNATINQSGISSYPFTGTAGRPSTIKINRTGRFVRVQLSTSDNLQLAEVQVMGQANTPVAPTAAPIATNPPAATAKPANTAGPTTIANKTAVPTNTPTNTSIPVIANTAVPAPTQTADANTPINLSLNKPAVQSSTYAGAAASRAVDGNTDGVLANHSLSHTNSDAQAWWQVDLGASYNLKTINLWNRTDCCDWRLTNFYVFVSDVPFTSTNLVNTINQAGMTSFNFTGTAGRPTTIQVNRTGRYVRVQLTTSDNLQLAEVQVMGLPTAVTVTPPNTPIAASSTPTSTCIPTSQATATLVPSKVPPLSTSTPTQTPTTNQPTAVPTISPTGVK